METPLPQLDPQVRTSEVDLGRVVALRWRQVLEGRLPDALRHRVRRAFLSRTSQIEGQQGPDCHPQAGPPGDRGLAEDLSRSVAGSADVPHLRKGRVQRAGRPTFRQELPRMGIRPISRKLGITDRLVTFQVMRRFPWNPPSGAWNVEGYPERTAPRQYYDDRQCVCAGHRGDRDTGGQLSRHGGLGWLDADGGGSRAEGPEY